MPRWARRPLSRRWLSRSPWRNSAHGMSAPPYSLGSRIRRTLAPHSTVSPLKEKKILIIKLMRKLRKCIKSFSLISRTCTGLYRSCRWNNELLKNCIRRNFLSFPQVWDPVHGWIYYLLIKHNWTQLWRIWNTIFRSSYLLVLSWQRYVF